MLHEQHDVVGTERVATGVVRFRRRIVTETRRVEVVLRREVLEFDPPLGPTASGSDEVYDVDADVEPDRAAGSGLVVELNAEVPFVTTEVRAVERVRVGVRTVPGNAEVELSSAREQVEVRPVRT